MLDKKTLIKEFTSIFYEITQMIGIEKNKFLKSGISWSQFWVLKMLNDQGPLKITEVAEKMGVSVPAVTALSDKLIRQELAERDRCDEDRRVVYLHITEKGTELLQEFRQYRHQMMEKYMEGLPVEDLQHLIRIYKKIRDNMKTS
ncbi:putative HTH-type transcriptional regulator YusO [Tepidibacillus sp. HK-1]|nr:putative HTH-type transcriptional regulator YusO [Tepidibacillus sp. HK-1]